MFEGETKKNYRFKDLTFENFEMKQKKRNKTKIKEKAICIQPLKLFEEKNLQLAI